MRRDPYLDLKEIANTEMDSGGTIQEAVDSALNDHPELSVARRRVLREWLIAELNEGKNSPGEEED